MNATNPLSNAITLRLAIGAVSLVLILFLTVLFEELSADFSLKSFIVTDSLLITYLSGNALIFTLTALLSGLFFVALVLI